MVNLYVTPQGSVIGTGDDTLHLKHITTVGQAQDVLSAMDYVATSGADGFAVVPVASYEEAVVEVAKEREAYLLRLGRSRMEREAEREADRLPKVIALRAAKDNFASDIKELYEKVQRMEEKENEDNEERILKLKQKIDILTARQREKGDKWRRLRDSEAARILAERDKTAAA